LDGGTVLVFLLYVGCSGCGTVEMVGGWFGFLFIFSILLLVFLVGGCLWWVILFFDIGVR
jgi:hypothetical protein